MRKLFELSVFCSTGRYRYLVVLFYYYFYIRRCFVNFSGDYSLIRWLSMVANLIVGGSGVGFQNECWVSSF